MPRIRVLALLILQERGERPKLVVGQVGERRHERAWSVLGRVLEMAHQPFIAASTSAFGGKVWPDRVPFAIELVAGEAPFLPVQRETVSKPLRKGLLGGRRLSLGCLGLAVHVRQSAHEGYYFPG